MLHPRLLLGSAIGSALLVFLVALATRLVFLIEFSSLPLFHVPIMDMLFHHQWAKEILAGRGPDYTPFFRSPLYPHFLALVYGTVGDGSWAIRLIQTLLGSLSAVLVYLIGRPVFGQVVGLVRANAQAPDRAAVWNDYSSPPLLFDDCARFHDVSNTGQVLCGNQVWQLGSNEVAQLSAVTGNVAAINDHGQVVGGSDGHAALWDPS